MKEWTLEYGDGYRITISDDDLDAMLPDIKAGTSPGWEKHHHHLKAMGKVKLNELVTYDKKRHKIKWERIKYKENGHFERR